MRISLSRRFSVIVTVSWISILASCRYEAEFDALSTFPSNRNQREWGQVDFIPVDRVDSKRRNRGTQTAESVKLKEELFGENGLQGSPYVQRSIKRSGKFVRLNPLSTGFKVVSSTDIEPAMAEQIRSPFTAPGIAIGDINDDGFSDIFVSSRSNGGRLYINNGDFNFSDTTDDAAIELPGIWGTGCSMVDINDDGLLDIYICCYDAPNRLYINRRGKFREQAKRYGLDFRGASTQAVYADYDGDGDLDMYLVTNRLIPDQVIKKLPVVREPGQAPRIREEFREQNRLIQHRDGRHIAVPSGQYDYLFRNDGYRFVDVTEESGIGRQPFRGTSAVWWDFNNDQWPDLYVANDHEDPDQLFRNNGPDSEGRVTFTEVGRSLLTHVPLLSKGVDCADLNNDGFFDLLGTGSVGRDRIQRLLSTGNLYGDAGQSWLLNYGSPPQQMANVMLVNSGGTRLLELAQLAGVAATDWAWSVRAADLDHDGYQDLLYGTGRVRDFLDNDLNVELDRLSDGSDATKYEFWLKRPLVRTSDFAFRNLGDLQFEDMTSVWGMDEKRMSQVLATADLDNDGDLDLVCSGFGDEARIYRNELRTQNSVRIRLVGVQSNSFGLGTRIRLQVKENGAEQTRYLNPGRGFMASNEPVIHFGVGSAERIHRITIDWPSGLSQQRLQLKSNHLYVIEEPEDLTWVSRPRPSMANTSSTPSEDQLFSVDRSLLDLARPEELEFDDFRQQPLIPFRLSQLGPGLAWGDIDNDGDDDLFRSGPAFDQSAIFQNNGATFEETDQACFRPDQRSEDLGAIFLDVDGDHDQDLYVVSGGVESDPTDPSMRDRLYLNDGRGSFQKTEGWLPDLPLSGGSVSAADFDRDGRVDLFVGGRVRPGQYPENPGSVLLRNTGDGFEDVTDQLASDLSRSGMVLASLWVDLDNDDWPDLVIGTEWGPVRVYRNDAGRLTDVSEQADTAHLHGFFSSVSAGDVDSDGDTDLVVGNVGLNTEYQPSRDNPCFIYRGPFGPERKREIVEAVSDGGVIYPRVGLERLRQVIPQLADQFTSVREFARTPLDQVFSEDILNDSVRLQIDCLESGILLNESEGETIRFEFQPLPRLAQTSPLYGTQLVDINADGHLDLIGLQNNSDVFPENVPFDNGLGLVLLGRGDGQFDMMPPSESGLEISADGTALTAIDVNGDNRLDFVAATKDDGIQCLMNRADKFTRAIDVRQLAGKRNFLGAKIVLRRKDGSQQLHQITSNNGYLSQSPPVIHIAPTAFTRLTVKWPDGTSREVDLDEIPDR